MSLNAKQFIIAIVSLAIVIVLGYVIYTEKELKSGQRKIIVKSDSKACVRCHGYEDEQGAPGSDPGVVRQWESSVHAAQGVGCMDCHGIEPAADEDDPKNNRYLVKTVWDRESGFKTTELLMENGRPVERPDIWEHEGAEIVTNVSPRTCERCHEKEAFEFFHSRHSSAAQFIGSLDNFLGRFAEGPAAANNGCQQCHGSRVRLIREPGGDMPVYTPDTWPNTGMGRVNMDGSWGSCTACHSRHEFAAEVARRPESCGKCHMGPDHPQIEIYQESKHGIAFAKNQDSMGIEAEGGEWVLGRDYWQAPVCSSCHMGPVAPHGNHKSLDLTHDVGARISWTLRPKVSFKPEGITSPEGEVILKDAEGRRRDMQTVCMSCHSNTWVKNFYVQYAGG